jgi:hypothetical protein
MTAEGRHRRHRQSTRPGVAALFEIATHLDLEALALAWSMRNRQAFLDSLDGISPRTRRPARPFAVPDPTCGATHFHRHDEPPPDWAISEPIALIGDYLFYDLRRGRRRGLTDPRSSRVHVRPGRDSP